MQNFFGRSDTCMYVSYTYDVTSIFLSCCWFSSKLAIHSHAYQKYYLYNKRKIKLKHLQAPHTRPSISMVLTLFSISAILVSSSQGLTSSNTEDLAIRAGFLDFFSEYAFNLSSRILAASASWIMNPLFISH